MVRIPIILIFLDPLLKEDRSDAVLFANYAISAGGVGLYLSFQAIEFVISKLAALFHVKDHIVVEDVGASVLEVDIFEDVVQLSKGMDLWIELAIVRVSA
jgi:hypothetical protein